MTAQLDALLVRVIRIEAVASQMKFDVSRITARPARPSSSSW